MIKKLSALFLFLATTIISVQAQETEKLLQPDPQVKTGKLDNGLVYYIRHNEEPKNRVELRLAINAGSICEDDDQQGLAHLLEHMCFNGTEHFEKSALVDFLEKTGVKFGAHLNAYTSFDETVYMLQMPTDRAGLIDSAFLVLEDWAHNVTLDSTEIDKERGVVKEEWRLGLGAQQRMMKKYIPIILKDSKYARRIPIGQMDVIDTAHYSTLRRFYHDWYRPDLMAVIVVGDIDPDKMEQEIKDHFSSIKNPVPERKRETYDIPGNKEPLIAIETDEEAMFSLVSLNYKHPRKKEKTINDYREHLIHSLYSGMLNQRLMEIAQKPDAPFMYSGVYYGGYLGRTLDAYSAYAMAKENKLGESLKVLMDENMRVEKHGFTETEFERQKERMLRNYEKQFNEKDKQPSRNFVQEYLNNFLEDEPYPGIEAEYEMVKELLPGIKLEEVNILPKKWITDTNMIVLITAPEKEGLKVPTEQEVMEIIKQAENSQQEAYEDKVSDNPLVTDKIEPGKIINITKQDTLYEKWELSNGMTVYVMPTDFKNDEILYQAYSAGGSSLVDDSDILEAKLLPEVLSNSGIGEFDAIALGKKLAGKICYVGPYLYDLNHGFKGNSSVKDLETMLQEQYLYFMHPRQDSSAFQKVIETHKDRNKFILNNPRVAFYDTLSKVTTMNSPRSVPFPSVEQLEKVDMQKIFDIYKKLYQHANGFRVFFVGNVDTETLKPLVEKYLASIPVGGEALTWKDVEPGFPEGKTEFTYYKGKEPQSQVVLTSRDPYDYNGKNNLIMKTMKKVLSIKLREKVREEESGTYGIFVRNSVSKYPKKERSFMIGFGCAPENTDKLVKVVFQQMDSLKINGPAAEDMVKAKETFIRERETDDRLNKKWLQRLIDYDFLGKKIISADEYKKEVEAVTAEDVKKLANQYIPTDHYVLGVLKPVTEKKE